MDKMSGDTSERGYLERGGGFCRHCGNEDLEGDNVEVNDGQAFQEVVCLECGTSWTDVYTLTHVKDYTPTN